MPHKVLVADDSPTIQKRASGILTSEGLEVVTVSNGVAAIKKLPQIKPSVILADVSMPGKDGYEVCDFVKNSPELCHIPVVLVHSDLEPYDEARGARVRADGKIKKRATGIPFDPEELVATISKFVAQADASSSRLAAQRPAEATHALDSTVVIEPVDAEPEAPARKSLDLSTLTEGVPFAESAAEEAPAGPVDSGLPGLTEPVAEQESSLQPAAEASAPETSGYPVADEPPVPGEPVLIEEAGPATAEAEGPSAPVGEQTAIFRRPAEIADPMLSDELAAPTPLFEPVPSATDEGEAPPVTATTLESYSWGDATGGQVRFVPPQAETAPVAETASQPPPPEGHPAPTLARQLDPNLVYSIVHKVVVRLSPALLSPQVMQEIARRITDEIVGELTPPSSEPI